MDIVIHSKDDCPYCEATVVWLNERKIPFKKIVYNDINDRQAMYDGYGLEGTKRTVPQIVVDGIRLGGYNDLLASDVADRAAAGNFDADF